MRPVGGHENLGFYQLYDSKHPGEDISKEYS